MTMYAAGTEDEGGGSGDTGALPPWLAAALSDPAVSSQLAAALSDPAGVASLRTAGILPPWLQHLARPEEDNGGSGYDPTPNEWWEDATAETSGGSFYDPAANMVYSPIQAGANTGYDTGAPVRYAGYKQLAHDGNNDAAGRYNGMEYSIYDENGVDTGEKGVWSGLSEQTNMQGFLSMAAMLAGGTYATMAGMGGAAAGAGAGWNEAVQAEQLIGSGNVTGMELLQGMTPGSLPGAGWEEMMQAEQAIGDGSAFAPGVETMPSFELTPQELSELSSPVEFSPEFGSPTGEPAGDWGPDPEPYDPSTLPTEADVLPPGGPTGGDGSFQPPTPGGSTTGLPFGLTPAQIATLLGTVATVVSGSGSGSGSSVGSYTGGIPSLQLNRTQLPSDLTRRPGSAPNRYFTNATYTPKTLAKGGVASLSSRFLRGAGDGLSDEIPAAIEGREPARLANNEFVVSADVVSALGGGSSEAGAKKLYQMMDRIRQQAHGNKKQIRPVSEASLPA